MDQNSRASKSLIDDYEARLTETVSQLCSSVGAKLGVPSEAGASVDGWITTVTNAIDSLHGDLGLARSELELAKATIEEARSSINGLKTEVDALKAALLTKKALVTTELVDTANTVKTELATVKAAKVLELQGLLSEAESSFKTGK